MADIISEYEDKLPSKIIDDIRNNLPKGVSDTKLKKVMEAVYGEYESAKVHPGESVGLISAESIGEPGTQMCVSKNEKVILKSNNKIKIVEIGEFVDKVFENVETRIKDNYEVYNVPNELLVLSLDQKEKLKWSQVMALNRIKAPKKLIEIKTRSGRKITATDFHSFVTRKNNKVISIAGKELSPGDRIPVMRYLPEHCASLVCVNEYISNVKEENGILSRPKSRAKTIPNNIKLGKSFGWFIGAYLAEGHVNEGCVSISNVNEKYISHARKFVKSIGLNFRERWSHSGFALSRDLVVHSSLLANFIKSICNKGSANKKVPDFAYNAKEEFVIGLLKGYFDGDGNITVERKMIRVSSNSKELIDGISLLLNRFKIFSRKSIDKKGQNWLQIPYNYAKIFLEQIGSDIDYKKLGLIKLSKISKNRENESLDQIEMVSGYGTLFYDTAKKLGMHTRYVNNFTKRGIIGRKTLGRYITKFTSLSKVKNVNINKELDIMRTMANADVVWDEIVSINYVEYQHRYVYDLSVPGDQTFTTFDGIVSHNTLNTFHFAGVAEMNVTLGLPRIIEILDGRKDLENPMMEIYLKKPYATGKRIDELRQLALQIKETKLKDIATEFAINIADFTIDVKLDREKMKELELALGKVLDAISKQLKGYNIKDNKDLIILKSRSKEETFNEAYKTKEKIKEVMVKGIKGISHVLPVKREEEFVIITAGSNLADVLQLEEVDAYRTTTNNIFEIEQVLGIEAARQAIINEIFKVIESQGLNVDVRHIMLVADTMCVSGTLKGITRYGVVSEKSSVLARASFETPIKHIINAALVGEVDNLDSVVENVMINQPVPIGTGLPSLVVKSPKAAKEK